MLQRPATCKCGFQGDHTNLPVVCVLLLLTSYHFHFSNIELKVHLDFRKYFILWCSTWALLQVKRAPVLVCCEAAQSFLCLPLSSF